MGLEYDLFLDSAVSVELLNLPSKGKTGHSGMAVT